MFPNSLDLLLALILLQLVVMVKCCFSELEAALLKELDPQLHSHLVTDNMEKISFCHRWVFFFFFFSFSHFINLFVFHSGGSCWLSSGSLSTAMLCVCLRFSAVITCSSSHSRWITLDIRRDWHANTAWVRNINPMSYVTDTVYQA